MRPWWLTAASLAVLAGCAGAPATEQARTDDPEGGTAVRSQVSATGTLPAGWRWESYGEAAVGVPQSWGHGITDQAWCAQGRGKSLGQGPPYVGRPGPIFAIACGRGAGDEPDPGTLVEHGGTFVWFDRARQEPGQSGVTGDRVTVTVGNVRIRVQADAELRYQILKTVRHMTGGINGCPLAHPIADDFTWSPTAGTPVHQLTGIRHVSACKYNGFLASSVRVVGLPAARAVEAIADADPGGGPDSPETCVEEEAYGAEIIVLRVRSDQGLNQIVMRYSGCDHHGFDDGHTVHRLTREAALPFVSGANHVTVSAGNLRDILH